MPFQTTLSVSRSVEHVAC